jgi:L-2-hydroxyglutarate oxidase
VKSADLLSVGGGIVGLATAYRFMDRYPRKTVIILEKEAAVAQHQSGHNSGVVHSGIYYQPGTFKAAYCREGKNALEAFCAREGIEVRHCGKVIVATCESELSHLRTLYDRGRAEGIRCEIIEPHRLQELEPHAAELAAIHVPEAGIVDFRLVCQLLAEVLVAAGVAIMPRSQVLGCTETRTEVRVESTQGELAPDLSSIAPGSRPTGWQLAAAPRYLSRFSLSGVNTISSAPRPRRSAGP